MFMISFVIISENYFFREGLIHFISNMAMSESFIPIFILDNNLSVSSGNCILIHDYPFSLLQIMKGMQVISSNVMKEISMGNTILEKKRRERKKVISINHKFNRIYNILSNHITIAKCLYKNKKGMHYTIIDEGKSLTQKQIDFLNCLAEGLSVKQSALKMDVCTKTIYAYKSRIKSNTGCHLDIDITKWISAMDMLSSGKPL
ncbi:regulatory protein, luxR family [Izhakiella capsodis]|uniref:Regulatory protein, luxR family n=1 Tax=Izhakiella capsodis TaxID=1367852 RepID=A0A1I4YJK0_9GAMM|nr:LuxR C-terminal-related transcriptional regulator [Izhakiella capsodis]SFN38195.1 regulatory protein, luxR family [Izhakiella capsodis]